ncbi:MAG: TIGR02391 family protein, partial [Phycisphaerae bacterium]|nr:TIGR02391 family protein [Phycisphaerae bacterium]
TSGRWGKRWRMAWSVCNRTDNSCSGSWSTPVFFLSDLSLYYAKFSKEKKEDFGGAGAAPSTYFDRLNLHPRILDVSRDLFLDGHPWEAVFAAAKALVNHIKERSGRHDLDGAPLVRAVFSRNDPLLAFNDLSDPTDLDEQEGMMHLFEGAVLGIRNPGGHSFPEGPEQRAVEYISLLSLLAYRVQEAKRRKGP